MAPRHAAPADVVRILRAAGCVFAEDEARLLLEADAAGGDLPALTARRAAGEPLEQVLGWAELDGLRVAVEPGVFVPRRRSALLVREALRLLPTAARPGSGPPLVVDLCCGTGALGAAVAARRAVEVHAADLEDAAVRCARRNLPGHHVHQGDLWEALPDALRGRVDVVLANAPYVPTARIALMPPEARDHEPTTALDGGPDGTAVQARVAAGAAAWLRPGGHLLVETSRAQAGRTLALLASGGLDAGLVTDDDLDATVAVGRRPS
ncbi:putative protein N(5)-glutamine methyltransferase [Actinotalea solisilvae]|uniref:putative protein N(5)-glutamine methyltransferase n=1 Tax=Actinotalea solisilvae TaxID=2072922 RepID=UPI0027DC7EC7|nr:putative protein N(5)-glutamine methyltransferase [Actinotalea solisilvae]